MEEIDLNNILDQASTELRSLESKPKQEVVKVDANDEESVSEHLVDMVNKDREKADQLFSLFYGDLAIGKDHSQASKEAVMRALELKIEASKNIIELLKIKAKKSDTSKTANGVMINVMSEKKFGVDLQNVFNHVNDN